MRIRELSKELGLSNNEIINKLKELGIDGKVASSGITTEEEKRLRDRFTGGKKAPKTAPEAGEKPEKAEKKAPEVKPDKPAEAQEGKHRDNRHQGGKNQDNRRQNDRNQGDRRQGERRQGDRNQNDRRQGERSQNDRRQGDRPQNDRRQGDRNQNDRRQSDRNQNDRRQGDRPQGDRNQDGRRQGGRPQGGGFNSDRRQSSDRNQASDRFSSGGDRRRNNDDKRSSDRRQGGDKFDDKFESKAAGKNSKSGNKNKPERQEAFKPEKDIFHGENTAQNPKKNKKKKKAKAAAAPEPEVIVPEEEEISVIELGQTVTVGDLAEKLGKKSSEIIMKLMVKGVMASINQEIERDLAETICEDYGVIVEDEVERDIAEEIFAADEDDEADLKERPPVVVVMGHVDHGKTSLLDAIRKTKVTAEEAGGITQHIGAYTVSVNGKPITFLDTPGHEAFTAMRMRGALVTDIAVLVVAADDGVMPQTIEAINHAKAAGVEIIVAINKIDKPSANPERVKQELTEYGLLVEDWGGETIVVPVSAATKEGIDQLLEMIILVAEMKELKANPNKRASGNIIEARLDKGRGPVATALVKAGALNVGDPVVVGGTFGRVRAMVNDKGKQIKKAGPSVPVEILGLNDVPHAGDMFYVAKNEKQARQVAETIIAKSRIDMLKETQRVSLEDLFSQIQSGNVKELNIVIKADVQGSVEAVRASLEKLSNDEVRIKTIHGGVGAITESDVMLASASNAIIIGFNVRPEASAKSVAEDQKVDIRLYRVIYNAIDDIRAAIKGMLDPEYVEKIIGHAEVRQIFNASGVGTIAGSYVKDGKITRNSKVRLLRDNVVVYEGEVATLRRYKDDVKEVATSFECGILLNKFNDVKLGDIIEAFVMEEIKR